MNIHVCVCAHACYGLTCLQTLHIQALVKVDIFQLSKLVESNDWYLSLTLKGEEKDVSFMWKEAFNL